MHFHCKHLPVFCLSHDVLLINFYIWLLLVTFLRRYIYIDSISPQEHGIHHYTLALFMVIFSWYIANNARHTDRTPDVVCSETFHINVYKFSCVAFLILHSLRIPIDSNGLCVSSFKLSNKFHIQLENLHQTWLSICPSNMDLTAA